MKTLQVLVLDCSPRGANSTSRHLSEILLPKLSGFFQHAISLKRRYLGAETPPAICADYADSLLLPAEQVNTRFAGSFSTSDTLIEELKNSDIVWISTPVHNFTVPAVLKNWIDLVVRKDVTFTTTGQGKTGLLKDRPVFVAVTAGGVMFEDGAHQPDFFRPYLSAILSIIGLKNIQYIPVTGLAREASPFEVIEKRAALYLHPAGER